MINGKRRLETGDRKKNIEYRISNDEGAGYSVLGTRYGIHLYHIPYTSILLCSGGLVEGTADAVAAAFQDMGVDHGGLNVFMSQQFLHSTDIVAIFQQMGGKAVTQSMGAAGFGNSGISDGFFNSLLHGRWIEMVAVAVPGSGIDGEICSRKHILPDEFLVGIGIFFIQGIGKINLA